MTLMIPQRPHIARHLTPRGVMRAGGAANEPRSSQRPLYCKLTVRPLASCRTGERNSPDYHGIFVATASSPLLWLCAAHTHGHMHRELRARRSSGCAPRTRMGTCIVSCELAAPLAVRRAHAWAHAS